MSAPLTEQVTAFDAYPDPQLVDPREAAFAASDPSILPTREVTEDPNRRSKARTALELAAAIYTVSTVVRASLTGVQDLGKPHELARLAWGRQGALWKALTVPAIRRAFELGSVQGLTTQELTELAVTYAGDLGDYLGVTNADALVDGMNRQLNAKWDERVAYERAAAGYGLDRRSMTSYLAAAVTGTSASTGDLISSAARALADKALLLRADRIGESESHTATETGKSLAWLYIQRRGGLPPNARRRWSNVEAEGDCAECRHLHEQEVPLDQPFVMTSGVKIWAPQAHPNCQCHVELVVPTIEKADRQFDPKKHPKGYHGYFTDVPVRDEAVDEMMEQARARPEAPVKSAFAGLAPAAPTSAFTGLAAASTSFAGLGRTAFPGAKEEPPSASPFAAGNPFASLSRTVFEQEPAPKRKQTILRHTVVVLPPGFKVPPKREKPYYAPADGYAIIDGHVGIGNIWDNLAMVSFRPRDKSAEFGLVANQDNDPWDALDADIVYRDRVLGHGNWDRKDHLRSPDVIDRAWEDTLRLAKPVWDSVMANPERYVEMLRAPKPGTQSPELQTIAENAGLSGYGDDADLRKKIVEAVNGRGRGNDSLAWAFADFVTYEHPAWVHEEGLALETHLSNVLSTYNIDFTDTPVQQVFVFDGGYHPGDRRHGDQTLVPSQDYIVTSRTYRSALADASRRTPRLFNIGLSEAHMSAVSHVKATRMDRRELS